MKVRYNASEVRLPDRPPKHGEVCGLADHFSVKRAALLFERVHLSSRPSPFADTPLEITFGVRSVTDAVLRGLLEKSLPGQDTSSTDSPSKMSELVVKHMIAGYRRFGAEVVPVLSSHLQFSHEIPTGNTISYLATLEHIPEIDEESVSWNEILEFRSDGEALRKYRNLRLWLHESAQFTSLPHATDVIGNRLDDYTWALKKHGLKTKSGLVSFLLNAKQVVASTLIGSGIAAVGGSPILLALASGLTIAGQTCAWFVERNTERREIERGLGSELAVIYDAQKKFSSKMPT